jgi:hypothetical protein
MRTTRGINRIVWLLVCLAAAWYAAVYGDAALDVGDGMPGGELLAVPINFTPDPEVDTAGLQFDVEIDTSRFEVDSVIAGDAATQSGKGVMWSQPDSGRLRVLVAGMNQDAVAQGEVATVYLAPLTSRYDTNPCSLEAGICSGPFGDEVPVRLPSIVNENPDDLSNDPPAKTDRAASLASSESETASGQEVPGTEQGADESSTTGEPAGSQVAGTTASSTGYGGGVAVAPEERSDKTRPSSRQGGTTVGRLGGSPSPSADERRPIWHQGIRGNPSGAAYGRQGAPSRRTAAPGTVPTPSGGKRSRITQRSPEEPRRVDLARAGAPEPGVWPEQPLPSGEDRTEERASHSRAAVPTRDEFPASGVAAVGCMGAAAFGMFLLRRRWLRPRGAGRRQGL